jgi:hypothetical protein
VIHWLWVAFQTYVLHTEHGNGYAWWSGPGSDIGEVTLVGLLVAAYRHHNCGEPRCWRLGHAHPEHGQPVCRKHFHNDIVPKENL